MASQFFIDMPGPIVPLDGLIKMLPHLNRPGLEHLVELAIEAMDEADGDPDLEDYDVDLEDDDPAGGAADDDGEPEDYCIANYTDPIDQRKVVGTIGTHRFPVRRLSKSNLHVIPSRKTLSRKPLDSISSAADTAGRTVAKTSSHDSPLLTLPEAAERFPSLARDLDELIAKGDLPLHTTFGVERVSIYALQAVLSERSDDPK